MQFFSPIGFLALLGIPVILMLYLLKQKYQEKRVSSLLLWDRAISLTQAARPWQKLKKNLLLALQLLAVILFALLLANPYWFHGVRVHNAVLAIDTSMSMQATDMGGSRFDAAKADMARYIQDAPPETTFTLVALGDAPYTAVSATTDRNTVLEKLSALTPTAGGMNWEDGLSLLRVAQESSQGAVRIYTDTGRNTGGLAAKQLVFGKNTANSAITKLSYTLNGEAADVLVQVKNNGAETVQRTVTLYGDAVVLDVMDITLSPNETRDIVFSQVSTSIKGLEAKLTPEDALSVDDTSYAVLASGEPKKVLLVTEGNVFLEKAISLLPNVDLYKTDTTQVDAASGYALYIYDGAVLPASLPKDGHVMLWNPPSDNPLITLGDNKERHASVSGNPYRGWDFLGNTNFDIAEARSISVPSWAQGILQTQGDTIGIVGEEGNQKRAVFSFDLHNSDLPLKKEFPIMLYQLCQWYFPESTAQMLPMTAGDTVELPLQPSSQSAYVVLPSGDRRAAAPPFPAEPFTETAQPGLYTLVELDAERAEHMRTFAVNPKTEGESSLVPAPIPENDQSAEDAGVQGARSLRIPILLILLVLLAVEWRVSSRAH